jgi:hypothetical protein
LLNDTIESPTVLIPRTPLGRSIYRASMLSSNIKRWTNRRKAVVVTAVKYGVWPAGLRAVALQYVVNLVQLVGAENPVPTRWCRPPVKQKDDTKFYMDPGRPFRQLSLRGCREQLGIRASSPRTTPFPPASPDASALIRRDRARAGWEYETWVSEYFTLR